VSISSNPPGLTVSAAAFPKFRFKTFDFDASSLTPRHQRIRLRRHDYSKQIMNEHYMFHMCSATINFPSTK
jgi:hypothetical protein